MEVGYQVGLPLCRDDCVAVQHLFCSNEWLMIEESKVSLFYIFHSSVNHHYLNMLIK